MTLGDKERSDLIAKVNCHETGSSGWMPGLSALALPDSLTTGHPRVQLRNYHAILELAATQLGGVLWLWNAHDQVREVVSGSVEELWGIVLPDNPKEQFQAFLSVIDASHRPLFQAAFAPTSGEADVTIRIVHPTKGTRWLRIRKTVQPGLDDSCQVGLTRDITDEVQRLVQDQQQHELLKRADRLATLGILSASLVHDLNHSLNGINLAVGLLDQWIQELQPLLTRTADDAPEALACGTSVAEIATQMPILASGIQDTVRRMVAMHTQLRRYTKGAEIPPEELALDEVIRDVVALVHPYLERSVVRCALDLPPDRLHLRSQRIGLEQVLTNLITNAAQALSGRGGTITIGARAGDFRQRDAILWVTDDGPGLSADDQARLGIDFFTTRHDGTGLGWVIIRRVVGELGGTVSLMSTLGQGTRVEVRLPTQPPDSLINPPSAEFLRPLKERRS